MHTIEVWVVVDQNGDFDCGTNADNASERYADSIGGDLAGSRMVKMTLKVELPEPLTIEATLQ